MPREDGVFKVEAHVAALCLEEQEGKLRCLIGQRSKNRKLYPSLWECGGGQIEPNESFPVAVVRQMKEEFGIDVKVLFPFRTYSIQTPEGLIPGIGFICVPKGPQKIQLDERELIDFAWIAPEEASSYPMIPGLPADILMGVTFYSKLNKAVRACS